MNPIKYIFVEMPAFVVLIIELRTMSRYIDISGLPYLIRNAPQGFIVDNYCRKTLIFVISGHKA